MKIRQILGRALAGTAFALLLLGLVEGALRLALGPPPAPPLIRTVWWHDGEPFQEAGGMVTPVYQDRDMIPAFPAAKAPGTPRIMVFGESSVRGGSQLPASQEFAAILQQRLAERGQPAEVLNLGRVGLDSREIRYIVEEAVRYQPDVAVLYMGHNDVGNAYMSHLYGDVGSALEVRARLLLGRLRLYVALADALASEPQDPGPSGAGPGMGGKPLTPHASAMIVSSFHQNLDYIVRTLEESGARVVLATVASDLETWWTRVPACEAALPQGTWRRDPRGVPWLTPTPLPPPALQAAAAQAPDCPDVLYAQGISVLPYNRAAAIPLLTRARDLDPVPLRATSEIEQAIRDVAADRGATLVDVEAALAQRQNMRGYFVDNLHLSAAGHRLVAELLAPAVAPLLSAPAP